MKTRVWLSAALTTLGIALLCLGAFVFTGPENKAVSGSCIGLGTAMFCLGIGNLISTLLVSKTKDEEMRRWKAIEVRDERNTRIREMAGAKANQITLYYVSFVVIALGFMGESLRIILIVSSVLVLQLVLAIALTNYYVKRM